MTRDDESVSGIAQTVRDYFQKIQWRYQESVVDGAVVFTGGVSGLGGVYDSFLFVTVVGDDAIQNFGILPFAAKECLPQMAEFITRVNYQLKFGSFEMNWDDGRVRFHLTYPISALKTEGEEAVKDMFGLTAAMIRKHAQDFVNVLMGVKSHE